MVSSRMCKGYNVKNHYLSTAARFVRFAAGAGVESAPGVAWPGGDGDFGGRGRLSGAGDV